MFASDNYALVFENILRILRCTLHVSFAVVRIEFRSTQKEHKMPVLELIYCGNGSSLNGSFC